MHMVRAMKSSCAAYFWQRRVVEFLHNTCINCIPRMDEVTFNYLGGIWERGLRLGVV